MSRDSSNLLYKILKKIFEKFIPDKLYLFTIFNFNKLRGSHEYELFSVQQFLKLKRRFIDIGANRGMYSFYYSRHFKNVECFEPIKETTTRLACLNKKNISIHNIGLSNKNESKTLYIPYKNNNIATPLASINKPSHFDYLKRKIDLKTLDDFNFKDVDFIKIDVEGNELNVLKGAIKTIQEWTPILLIEIEQRHNTQNIVSIFNFIQSHGYIGFFFKNRQILSIEEFDYERDQKRFMHNPNNKQYINNFIFIPC